jgi:hypothetical protein
MAAWLLGRLAGRFQFTKSITLAPFITARHSVWVYRDEGRQKSLAEVLSIVITWSDGKFI